MSHLQYISLFRCNVFFFFAEKPHRVLQCGRFTQHDDNLCFDVVRKEDNLHVEETNETERLCAIGKRCHLSDDMATYLHTGATYGTD